MLKQVNKVPACLLLFTFFLYSYCNTLQAQTQCITGPTTPICAGNACDAGPATFTYTGPADANTTYKWDFGVPDIETDTLTTTAPTATYTYGQPGQYTVTVTAIVNGTPVPCTSSPVTVTGFGEFTITPDDNLGPEEEEICIGSSVTLTPTFQGGAPPNATYLWSDGSTAPTLTTDEAGCYDVTITDPASGCSRTQRVVVSLYKPDPAAPQPPVVQGIWYFGNRAGVRFVGGQAEAIGTPPDGNVNNINTPEGVSSVINRDGKLLFYTDGQTIWDSTGTALQNGTGLNGSPNSTQAVLIVQQPGCSDCETVYFVFTTGEITANGSQLSYSVVDMRANGGTGAVTQKNIPLFSSSTERVISITGNPTDPNAPATTWIVTHDFNSNTFRVYPFTAQGVGTPQTYPIGTIHGPDLPNGEGYVKASADGSQIAIVIPGADGEENIVELYDFDNATGAISNPTVISLGTAPPRAYGVEFFNDKLYVSLSGTSTSQSKLLQFSLTSADSAAIARSRVTIDSSANVYGALQVGPDQKIYLAIQNSSSLGVINNPAGNTVAEVDFQEQGLNLEGGTSQLGLPNNTPSESRSYGQSFGYQGPPCTDAGTPVTYQFQAQPDRAGGDPTKSTYLWTFPGGVQYTTYEVTHNFPGPGTYQVGLRIFNDCIPEGEDVEPQTIVISENPPAINLGDDRNICPSTEPLTLDPYPNANPAGISYAWTLPGGATATTKTVQVGQPGTYTVFAFSAGGQCFKADSVNIYFTAPAVNLGNDTTLCQAGNLVLNAGVLGATYQWLNVSTNTPLGNTQTITVGVTDGSTNTYRVTVTDPNSPACPVSDEIVVRGGTAPNIGTESTVAPSCTGTGTITLTGVSAGDQIRWAHGPTTASITAPPGVYTATITNASGCSVTVSAAINPTGTTLNYTSAITQPTCTVPTGSITISPAVGSSTGTNFIWRNSNGQTVQPSTPTQLNAQPGTYSVEISDAAGCRFSLTNLIIPPAPFQPQAPTPIVIPTGCGTATLNANYQGGELVTYRWTGPNVTDNGDGTAVANAAGVYTLTLTSQDDPSCSTIVTVTVPGQPVPIAIEDVTVCAEPGQLIQLDATTAGYNEYEWRNNANNTVVIARGPKVQVTAGTYTVVARNSQTNCPPVTDQVQVIFVTPPTAPAATSPAPICANSPVPALTATGAAGATFTWYSNQALTTQIGTGASFTPRISTASAGTITFYVTQTVGTCQSPAAPVTITINPAPATPTITGSNTFCPGGNSVLTSSAASGNQWNLNGQPISGATGQTLTVTAAGNYTVTVTAVGCSATSAAFTVNPAAALPAPVVQSPAGICVGEPVPALTATPTGTNTIQWYNNPGLTGNPVATGNSFTPAINNGAAGTFTFYAVQGSTGCLSPAAPVTVTINAVPGTPAIANPTQVICAGAGIAPFTINSPGTGTYIWYDNANLTSEVGRGTSFTPNLTNDAAPGNYVFYVVQTVGNCRSQPTQTTITINRSPVVNLGPDRNFCIDDSSSLDATNQGADVRYLWSTTQTTPTIRPTRSGTYSVTVTIGNCSVTDQVTITVQPSVRTDVRTREVALCTSDSPIRPVNLDAGPGDFTYFWPQLNSRERIVEVSQPGVYDVIITNAIGCSKLEKITVTDRCEARVFVPEAFTPDDQGPDENNVLAVFGDYLTDSRIIIYNRWGEVVYTAENILDPANYWDGTYLGQPAQSGNYAWKITYRSRDYPDRGVTEVRGGVFLIR